jgi:hypothetical protein
MQSVDVDCVMPSQSWLIDKDETRDMVLHQLKEDEKFLTFLTKFRRHNEVTRWPQVLNNGVIMGFPTVYFYFLDYMYRKKTGKRTIKVGFICWVRGIYASIDLDFQVYPEKSVYVDPHKAWRTPYSCVTYRVQIFEGNDDVNQNRTSYVRVFTDALLSIIRLCAEYERTDVRRECYIHGLTTYPSYRLADLLLYQQKLVSTTRDYMRQHCCCSFKTEANIPYCGCETLCSTTIPRLFADASCMNSEDVLFRPCETLCSKTLVV